MPEHFVIDTRSNRIINCVTTTLRPPSVDMFAPELRDHIRFETDPTQAQLEAYRYYWERP